MDNTNENGNSEGINIFSQVTNENFQAGDIKIINRLVKHLTRNPN